MTLDATTPPGEIFRVGWEPDPWRLPDWKYASGSPLTFGNRYDDPEGKYRVLYAGSSPLACFVEVLAKFRRDPGLADGLDEITVDPDDAAADSAVLPSGHVSTEWPRGRRLGIAEPAKGSYADLGTLRSLTTLRTEPRVARALRAAGVADLDGATLRSTTPRSVTQQLSRIVFEREPRFAGMHYLSKYGDDLHCWVIFEHPATAQAPVAVLNHESLDWTNAELLRALEILDIRLSDPASRRPV
jgi:RES domain